MSSAAIGRSLFCGVVAMVGDVLVVVPGLVVAVVDLHHAHAALDQPPRQQAGVGELALAVQLARGGRFAADVERLLRLALHAVGHLQRRDAGFELLVAPALFAGAAGSSAATGRAARAAPPATGSGCSRRG